MISSSRANWKPLLIYPIHYFCIVIIASYLLNLCTECNYLINWTRKKSLTDSFRVLVYSIRNVRIFSFEFICWIAPESVLRSKSRANSDSARTSNNITNSRDHMSARKATWLHRIAVKYIALSCPTSLENCVPHCPDSPSEQGDLLL